METLVIPPQHGGGFKEVMSKVHGFVKKHKLVSRGLRIIPHRYAHAAGAAADQLGYGKQLVIAPQVGGGFFDVIKKIGGFIKDNGLVSKGLSLIPGIGGTLASGAAKLVGFGKAPKKKRAVKKAAPQAGGRKLINLN